MSQGLVSLEGGEIVIRLTADANAFAWQTGMWADGRSGYPQETPPTVTDKAAFLRAVYAELTKEEENGDTPVHRMLDQALRDVFEQGCEGVDWDGTSSAAASGVLGTHETKEHGNGR
jgi:hypothetical protein